MGASVDYLVFEIASRQFAAPLTQVWKVVRAAALVELPRSPETMLGGLNVHGRIIPVLNLRNILGLQDKPLEPDDRMILFEMDRNFRFAGVADKIGDVVSWSDTQIDMQCRIFAESNHIFAGIGKHKGASVSICQMQMVADVLSIGEQNFEIQG